MTTARMHGVTANEYTKGIRPISDRASNIIGIVATAEDADKAVFPDGVPVFSTSVSAVIDAAGKKGTLYKALDAVLDQADAQIVVVRAAHVKEAEAQKTKIIEAVQALRRSAAPAASLPIILGT